MRMDRLLLALTLFAALPSLSEAYTAAGDRIFPATIVLPQVAPSDDAYLTTSTQPLYNATGSGSGSRLTDTSVTFDKTVTERLAIGFTDGWNALDQDGAGNRYGYQNVETMIQYLAVLDPEHELLVSVGADREWGGTGAGGIGASPSGATTPALYLGKGMGDIAAPWLRPFAVSANLSYSLADTNARADRIGTGLAIEYSIPYLESKVASVDLPDVVRAMTPIVEIFYSTPSSSARGTKTSGIVAPGLNYAGEGWEAGLEMLIPATRAAGSGLGVTAQFHVALDYFFPETLGRPLFSAY
ncbi:MAG TPA: hypothetical protein VL993_14095 [Stellaceae bacterium]|nr:hypothetical protein [Stellaceae bacterium]